MKEPILVSACLLGLRTRFDGTSKHNRKVIDWLEQSGYLPIPVCPEQLAGLPTPRAQTRFTRGDGMAVLNGHGEVQTVCGKAMNESFLHGARETLRIAQLAGCRQALLKERSPSCGVHRIYRGAEIVAGKGVAAALLAGAGLRLLSEEDLPG